jgi:hypothetical protein
MDGCRLLMRAASAAEVCGGGATDAAAADTADGPVCRFAEPGGVEDGDVLVEPAAEREGDAVAIAGKTGVELDAASGGLPVLGARPAGGLLILGARISQEIWVGGRTGRVSTRGGRASVEKEATLRERTPASLMHGHQLLLAGFNSQQPIKQ